MDTPSADQVLRDFLAATSAGKQQPTRARYRRIDIQLRRFLETSGPQFLEPEQERLLAMERDVEPYAAFCRLFHPEDIVFALPSFLRPPWLMAQDADRRTQIVQVARLVRWMCVHGLVDRKWHHWAVIETRIAVEKARQGYGWDPPWPRSTDLLESPQPLDRPLNTREQPNGQA